MDTSGFNTMQKIKHRFFALRNGAIADSMRRQGAPYKIIFGVNLPQLSAIATEIEPSAELAQSLWDNVSTRESMLLAPMVYPREQFDISTARKWVESATSAETVDILCMKLVKHMDYAEQLADELILSDSDMLRYAALRLMFNLLPSRLTETKAYALAELSKQSPMTISIATSLLQEISFLEEEN